MNDIYRGFLFDLIWLFAEDYNRTLRKPNADPPSNDPDVIFMTGENMAYYSVLSTTYNQLLAFGLEEDFKMPPPVPGEVFTPSKML